MRVRLKYEKVTVDDVDKKGRTPLYYAARRGRTDIVKHLVIECNADMNIANTNGVKPIHAAASRDYKKVVSFFLQMGAKIDDTDRDGWTPLHFAAEKGHLKVVEFLVGRKANINAKNAKGQTPLDLAKFRGHSGVVEFLKKAPAARPQSERVDYSSTSNFDRDDKRSDLANLLGNDYNSIKGKHSLRKIKSFINQIQNINKTYKDGNTLVHLIVECNDPIVSESFSKIIDLLKERGANFNSCNGDGNTPLHLAIEKDNMSLVKELLDVGAHANLDVKNKAGKTPLDLASNEMKNLLTNYSKEGQRGRSKSNSSSTSTSSSRDNSSTYLGQLSSHNDGSANSTPSANRRSFRDKEGERKQSKGTVGEKDSGWSRV